MKTKGVRKERKPKYVPKLLFNVINTLLFLAKDKRSINPKMRNPNPKRE